MLRHNLQEAQCFQRRLLRDRLPHSVPPVKEAKPKGSGKKIVGVIVAVLLLIALAGAAVFVFTNQMAIQTKKTTDAELESAVDEIDALIDEVDESSYSTDTLDEITNEFLDEDLQELDILDIPTTAEDI